MELRTSPTAPAAVLVEPHTPPTAPTAVLVDLENVIGGYTKPDTSITLGDILDSVQERVGNEVQIKRVYADWSNPRLRAFSHDLLMLGMTPIQHQGFGHLLEKNAADMHIAVDAMQIVLEQPHITTFVIVSGDGAFSALANKLHEYGKKVVGCARNGSTSRVFQAVCDVFLPIGDEDNTAPSPLDPRRTHKLVIEYAKEVEPCSPTRAEALQCAHELIDFFSTNNRARRVLTTDGLNIGVFSEGFKYRTNGFDYLHMGFPSLPHLLHHLTVTHPTVGLAQTMVGSKQYKLVIRNAEPMGVTPVDRTPWISDVHTVQTYRDLLGKRPDTYRLPDQAELRRIIAHLVAFIGQAEILRNDLVGHLVEVAACSDTTVEDAIDALITAQCITTDIEDEDVARSEQVLSIVSQSGAQIRATLNAALTEKLRARFGNEPVNQEVLNALLV